MALGDRTGHKLRRKLTRAQITEILERNLSLYKDESTYVHYLVELAIYLLEYEYDWAESGEQPPNLRPRPEDAEPICNVSENNGKIVSSKLAPRVVNLAKPRECPFCGAEVGESKICPKCRNIAK